MVQALKPIAHKVKTITCDNGLKYSAHAYVDAALKSTFYFADPYRSWQRGTNENTNGLVRQYIPSLVSTWRYLLGLSTIQLTFLSSAFHHAVPALRLASRYAFQAPPE